MSIFTNPKIDERHLMSLGQVHWSAPSNIALVKYWGKKTGQIPCNPSVSLTLDQARTHMQLSWRGRTYLKQGPGLKFLFEGQKASAFEQKIQKLLELLAQQEGFAYLNYFDLELNASNSFPHSAGIASSASSMAALALCLLSMRAEIFEKEEEGLPEGSTGKLKEEKDFYRQASYLARLGSGSACRSVYPFAALWGKVPGVQHSSDQWAVQVEELGPHFQTFKDAILLMDSGIKKVSSREGHALMDNHPHAESRFERAQLHTKKMLEVLQKKTRDRSWIELVEAEALELHGLMMTSTPAYILMRPRTLSAIEKIQDHRQRTGLEMGLTLDAGANLHLLYPASESEAVEAFIADELVGLCENGKIIYDQVGAGPRREVFCES